jgi:hypothetical protein
MAHQEPSRPACRQLNYRGRTDGRSGQKVSLGTWIADRRRADTHTKT